ncbi:MAG: hypothetical protein ACOC2W_03585 [bacterium]
MMMNSIKEAYCIYITQLLLQCDNDLELNDKLDKLSEHEFDKVIMGDNDIKKVLNHVYKHRLYNQSVINQKPEIDFKTVAKAVAKSLF